MTDFLRDIAASIERTNMVLRKMREERMANETNADRRGRQRDALKSTLSGLSADATKHLAEEVREAAHSDPATHRRVIEIFERLGVTWPNGYKP